MRQIFISYAHNDILKVRSVVNWIHSLGPFHCWIDESSLQGGDYWTETITNAILASEKLLLFMSPASMLSEGVANEIQIAFECKVMILILKLEPVQISPAMMYPLARIQWIDYSRPGWDTRLAIALDKPPQTVSTSPGRTTAPVRATPPPAAAISHGAAAQRAPLAVGKGVLDLDTIVETFERDFVKTPECIAACDSLRTLGEQLSFPAPHSFRRRTYRTRITDLIDDIEKFRGLCETSAPERPIDQKNLAEALRSLRYDLQRHGARFSRAESER